MFLRAASTVKMCGGYLQLVERGVDGMVAVFRGRWRPKGEEENGDARLAAFKILKILPPDALEGDPVLKSRYEKSLLGLRREDSMMTEHGGKGPFLRRFEAELDAEAPAFLEEGDAEKACIFVAFPWLSENYSNASTFFAEHSIPRIIKETWIPLDPMLAEAGLRDLTYSIRMAIRGLLHHLRVHKTAFHDFNSLAQDNLVKDIFTDEQIANPTAGPLPPPSLPFSAMAGGRMIDLAMDIVLRGETQRSFTVRGDPALSAAKEEMPKEDFSRLLRKRSLERAVRWQKALCSLYDIDTSLPVVRKDFEYISTLEGHKLMGWVLE
ncbi:unnamed protein product [Vitrella brassicaformis CCMP3155]|uniref:Uncharacterized protein n=1 Tax=Vitrella brassicaformis (strain CCMP3155) TaxID=1169540 RepID=A0A0G4EEU0_VITBC|nr:unnamed protein product [Vitrella brassicaformis CCMP3155]|eukprot:CEL93888.1 unnamed protein product [Vitrella brassicaformis CCMP3155]